MSALLAKRKLEEQYLNAVTGLGGEKRGLKTASPGLQALRNRSGVLSSRKSMLFDQYEHRYIVTSKWDWVTLAITLATATVSLGIELMYCMSEEFYHVAPPLKYSYLFCTYILSSLPYIMMIYKSFREGGCRSFFLPRRSSVPILGTALLLLETFLFIVLVLPIWFFVGLGLYSSKLIVVTAVTKTWWGILAKFGVKYKSANDDLNSRIARLNTNDVDNMMPIRASARKPQRGGQRSIVDQIKQKASARQKRMAGGLELSLPRNDLNVDIALLSKIVLVELFVKYVPQYVLFFVINSRHLFGETKEIVTVLSAVSQSVVMVGSIIANWKVLRDRSWASNFQNINATLGGLFGSPKSGHKKLLMPCKTPPNPRRGPFPKKGTSPIPSQDSKAIEKKRSSRSPSKTRAAVRRRNRKKG